MIRRYRVQGETVRGEPRIYWVEDTTRDGRFRQHYVASDYTSDRRQAQRWCDKLNRADALQPS